MLTTVMKTLARWRTWLFNTIAAIIVLLPDVATALVGYNWGEIVPPKYMPLVTLAIIVVNIWMRPRPAVLAGDAEARAPRDQP